MNGRRRAAMALVVLSASLALTSTALAGNVTLWACHGPDGSPLGTTPFVQSTTGDGVIAPYGTGCAADAGAITDGGLAASFSSLDPAGGSQADLQLDVPAGVTLESVELERDNFGFGGTPMAGDELTYSASTPAGVLESTSLDGANDLTLNGSLSFPSVSGQDVEIGVSCDPSVATCSEPSIGAVGVDVSGVALTVSDTAAPTGAVAGVQSPVAGSENMEIVASDQGLGLASASAQWDNQAATTVALGGSTCTPLSSGTSSIDLALGADCPATVSGVPLTLSTSGLADGTHQLKVTVTDAAGNTTTLVNEPIQILNNPPTSSATATVGIGSGSGSSGTTGSTGSTGSSGSTGSGGTGGSGTGGTVTPTQGTTQPACDAPQLSARLRTKPARIKRGVAVLIKGKGYTFSGTLTCLIDGRRRAAPADTPVEVHALIGKRTNTQTGVALTSKGAFNLLLTFRKSETLEFLDLNTGATTMTAKIRLTVVRTAAR